MTTRIGRPWSTGGAPAVGDWGDEGGQNCGYNGQQRRYYTVELTLILMNNSFSQPLNGCYLACKVSTDHVGIS